MSGYVILEMEISDKNQLVEYKKLAGPTLKTYGGKVLVGSGEQIPLEGDWVSDRIVIIELSLIHI